MSQKKMLNKYLSTSISIICTFTPSIHLFIFIFFFFYQSIVYRWYRDGNPNPLQAIVNRGGSKDHQTTSILTITPTKEDDGARYRCVVYNRAMKEGEKYEATVTLSVNCEYNN
jgi:hypothetical protein